MSTPSHFEQKRADANEKYLGFAAQPAGGGVINILTGQDLQTGVVPSQAKKDLCLLVIVLIAQNK